MPVCPSLKQCGYGVVMIMAAAAGARGGEIDLTVQSAQPIVKVWAVQRLAHVLHTSYGRTRDIGMYHKRYPGRVEGGRVSIADLPVPGDYDLRFELGDGGVLLGWDTQVPESDYVGNPPLQPRGRKTILHKQANEQFTAFADQVRVLDITGNIQNAVVLVLKLRQRPSVGGPPGAKPWIFRIERWQWENPNEQTWVPYLKRPYYALIRRRMTRAEYRAMHLGLMRELGGIRLTADHPIVDRGKLKLPTPPAGVYAITAEGKPIAPIVLKGKSPRGATP